MEDFEDSVVNEVDFERRMGCFENYEKGGLMGKLNGVVEKWV
ncbi:hypothetical protein [Staphylococcus saprophyticus]|nr:hypothetical protein [Staphylococcus saprophyticus]